MDALIESLPKPSGDHADICLCCYTSQASYNEDDGNEISLAQIARIRAKGWEAYYCYDWNPDWIEYGGSSSIQETPSEESPLNDSTVYSLDGRLTNTLTHGIYIVGGKKVFKK